MSTKRDVYAEIRRYFQGVDVFCKRAQLSPENTGLALRRRAISG